MFASQNTGNPKAGAGPPRLRQPQINLSRIEELVELLKRNGSLRLPRVQWALSSLMANPGSEAAHQLLNGFLIQAQAKEAIHGRNPFVPLPKRGAIGGPFSLGTSVYSDPGQVPGLYEEELCQSIIACGMQGSGKSNWLRAVFLANAQLPNVRIWMMTKKRGDERGLAKLSARGTAILRENTPFSHADSMGLKREDHLSQMAHLFTYSHNIWLGPEAILADAASRLYEKIGGPPTWKEINQYIRGWQFKDRSKQAYLQSLEAKTRHISASLDETGNYRQGLDLRNLLDLDAVFELSIACAGEIRRFHVLHILSWVFAYRRSLTPEQLSQAPILVIMLDDAHEFFSASLDKGRIGSMPPLFEMLTSARSYKIALIVATHVPEELSNTLWACHGTTIAFRLPAEISRKRVAEVL